MPCYTVKHSHINWYPTDIILQKIMMERKSHASRNVWECCIRAWSFQSSLKYLQNITPASIYLQHRKSLLHQSYNFQSCSNWFIHPEKSGKQTHKLPAIQLAELFLTRSLNALIEPVVRGMTTRTMKQEKTSLHPYQSRRLYEQQTWPQWTALTNSSTGRKQRNQQNLI